jgi:hypothetical protein
MRNYTKAERAFIIMGILAGVSRDELNDKLLEDQRKTGQTIRIINENSFKMLHARYLPIIQNDLDKIWEHINHPKSISQLIAENNQPNTQGNSNA